MTTIDPDAIPSAYDAEVLRQAASIVRGLDGTTFAQQVVMYLDQVARRIEPRKPSHLDAFGKTLHDAQTQPHWQVHYTWNTDHGEQVGSYHCPAQTRSEAIDWVITTFSDDWGGRDTTTPPMLVVSQTSAYNTWAYHERQVAGRMGEVTDQ